MSNNPRLRGSSGAQQGPWPVGQLPDEILYEIGKRLVHCYAIDRNDISGDDFGDIFAAAINGTVLLGSFTAVSLLSYAMYRDRLVVLVS